MVYLLTNCDGILINKLYNLEASNADKARQLLKAEHGKDLVYWTVFCGDIKDTLAEDTRDVKLPYIHGGIVYTKTVIDLEREHE